MRKQTVDAAIRDISRLATTRRNDCLKAAAAALDYRYQHPARYVTAGSHADVRQYVPMAGRQKKIDASETRRQ